MDTAQWAQGIGSMSSTTTRPQAPPPPPITQSAQSSSHQQQQLVEKRARPVKEQALPCPRCNSTNTKFCYYNNYSLTQPRYFCKTCRRYWTEGGSLRNVPVGGGSRKNKRHSSSASSTTKVNPNLQAPPATITSSSLTISAAKPYQGQDLNLAFPDQIIGGLNFPGNSNGGGGLSAMELLRSTGITPTGLGPLGMHMSMPETSAALYGAAGFGLHDFKFPLDGNGNGHGMQEGGGGGGGRLLFPFGDLKQVSQVKSGSEISDQENRVQAEQAIFWSGANLGGNGGSW